MFRIIQDQDPKLPHQFKELFGQERPQLFHRDVLSNFLSSCVYRIYRLLLWKIWHLNMCSTGRFHDSMNRLFCPRKVGCLMLDAWSLFREQTCRCYGLRRPSSFKHKRCPQGVLIGINHRTCSTVYCPKTQRNYPWQAVGCNCHSIWSPKRTLPVTWISLN